MKHRGSPAVAFALSCLAACGDAAPQTVDAAVSAYRQNRVGEAEAAFRSIAADGAARPADKARALRETARIGWLVRGDAALALRALDAAHRIGEGRCDTAQLRARVLEEAGRSEQLLREAQSLSAQCQDPAEAGAIGLDAAEAALDLAAAGRTAALIRAEALFGALDADTRSGLGGASVQLELALRQGDAPAALAAWRNYFWLGEDDLPQALRGTAAPAAQLFAAGLAPDATIGDKLRLLDLLLRAGFFRQAQRFVDIAGLPGEASGDPIWTRFATYAEVRRSLEDTILRSYRAIATGGAPADLRAAVERATERLAAAAGIAGDRRTVLQRAYGLFGQAGDTGGFASVHLGHMVQNERRTVEQYGHRADVGFVALDNMISNGFETWLWDGSAATGGWTEPGPVIVQVRPEYASAPLRAWALFGGGAARSQLAARQREQAAGDAAALRDAAVAFLPGLADRLRLQVADRIGARARALAGPGADLRRVFLDEYWRATFQQSILAHEGRHAIDRTLVTGLARLDDANLEYRAKLSELALADYPRLALLNINDTTIGGDTAHGIANARILRALAEWMTANPAQVRGYDRLLPAMAQIDRLSDDQIRAIARALDPILR